MAKIYNILLLDDNEIIASCIQKRLLKASETFFETTQIEINPFHLQIDISNISKAGQIIEKFIIESEIHFLLLDRGFFDLIDPVKLNIQELEKNTLYIEKNTKSIKITEILKEVNFSKTNSLKGVVLYTYDEPSLTSEWYVEPAQIKKDLKQIIGSRLNPDNIDVVLTNSEIYHLANLKLYDTNPKQVGEYLEQGKKSEFMLYGLFMGEILYHRILKIIDKNQKKTLSKKKGSLNTKLILLFIVFTSLSIGGNAVYTLAMQKIQSNLGLILLSLMFSIVFPILILTIKPDWIISIDDD